MLYKKDKFYQLYKVYKSSVLFSYIDSLRVKRTHYYIKIICAFTIYPTSTYTHFFKRLSASCGHTVCHFSPTR